MLIELAHAGLCQLVTTVYAMEEARRNLELKRPEAIHHLEHLTSLIQLVPEANLQRIAWAEAQGLPPKDAPILAAAVESDAELLVTGDSTHFGQLYGKVLESVAVVNPAMTLQIVLEQTD